MSSITYGWEKHDNTSDSFWVKFARCSREPRSWKEEVYAAARAVTNMTTKPLYLCSNGSVDSEIMCQAFFDQGINFSVFTIEHAAGTNRHYIDYARTWCRAHDVEQKILYLDIPRFFEKEVPSYADQGYITGNVFRFFQIKLLEEVERLGGYAVFGDGEQLYRADAASTEVHLEFETGYAVPLEWCKRNKAVHEPYFYFSTPELCLSFLRIPIVAFAVREPELFRNVRNGYLFKRLVYQTYWPALEPRLKFSGYEHILPQRQQAQRLLAEKFGPKIQSCTLPISELTKQLSPETSK